jgi:hypothetical protein
MHSTRQSSLAWHAAASRSRSAVRPRVVAPRDIPGWESAPPDFRDVAVHAGRLERGEVAPMVESARHGRVRSDSRRLRLDLPSPSLVGTGSSSISGRSALTHGPRVSATRTTEGLGHESRGCLSGDVPPVRDTSSRPEHPGGWGSQACRMQTPVQTEVATRSTCLSGPNPTTTELRATRAQ